MTTPTTTTEAKQTTLIRTAVETAQAFLVKAETALAEEPDSKMRISRVAKAETALDKAQKAAVAKAAELLALDNEIFARAVRTRISRPLRERAQRAKKDKAGNVVPGSQYKAPVYSPVLQLLDTVEGADTQRLYAPHRQVKGGPPVQLVCDKCGAIGGILQFDTTTYADQKLALARAKANWPTAKGTSMAAAIQMAAKLAITEGIPAAMAQVQSILEEGEELDSHLVMDAFLTLANAAHAAKSAERKAASE